MRLSFLRADTGKLTGNAKAASEAALGVVAENVLADCTDYVPYETGALRRSGQASVRGGVGQVSWGTDADTAQYARVQYYGSFSHSTTANAVYAGKARGRWFEGAKAERKDAWRKMYAQEYERRIHG